MRPKTPLGYITLPDGNRSIFPTNNIFLNHFYDKPKNWESLRIIANLIIERYRTISPDTKINLITGKIKVQTQYKYLLSKDIKTTSEQDLKIIEDDEFITYTEIQNRANTIPPIDGRSVLYFGLGIGYGKSLFKISRICNNQLKS